MQRLKRWDFQDELTQMMQPIWRALSSTGASKNDVKIAIIQSLAFMSRFPEVSELNTGEIVHVMAEEMSEYPKVTDPIPLTLVERERPSTITAMHNIGAIITDLGYTHEERLRVLEMFRALLRHHLKASEDQVRGVRRSILQERDD